MRKEAIALLIILSISFTGCGGTTTIDLSENQTTSEKEIAESVVSEEQPLADSNEDQNVDIILSMYSFDDSETIEDYISHIDNECSVYDDSHYTITVKESERQDAIKQFNSSEYIEETFKDIFSDEQYNSAFIKMDYSDLFREVTFYVDREKYDGAGIAVALGPVIISGMYSDVVQAYNLIPPEERSCTVKIIDNDTNEIIYDSSNNE